MFIDSIGFGNKLTGKSVIKNNRVAFLPVPMAVPTTTTRGHVANVNLLLSALGLKKVGCAAGRGPNWARVFPALWCWALYEMKQTISSNLISEYFKL